MSYSSNIKQDKKKLKKEKDENTELKIKLNWYSSFDIDKSKQKCETIQEIITNNEILVKTANDEIIKSDKKIKLFQDDIKEIIKLEIKKKRLHIDSIEKDIIEFDKSIESIYESIKEIIKLEIKQNKLQLSIIKDKDTELNAKARTIKANIKTLINPLNWFSDEQTQFRYKYKKLKINIRNNKKLKIDIRNNKKSIQTIFETIDYLGKNIKNLSPNIKHYLSSNIDKEMRCLDELNTGVANKEKHKESALKLVNYLKKNISDIQPNIDKYLNANAKNILSNISKLQKSTDIKNSQKLSLLKSIRHSKKNIIDLKTEIDKYINFNEIKVKSDISNLKSEIDILQKEIERKEKIEIDIAPLEREIKKLKSNNMFADGDITRANSYCSQLDVANNSYERAKIHEKCELELNEGNPKKIINQKNSVIRSNDRNIEKLEHRITDIRRKGARVIDGVIIDGNNMCYEGSRFIGLSVLKKVIPELQKHYKITIIFDSVIRKLLHSGNKEIKSEFNNNVHIHIVSTKQYADESILDLASNKPHIFVISNDRYRDYPDKEVTQSDRLIRYEIIKNRIFINDLNIDISWYAMK